MNTQPCKWLTEILLYDLSILNIHIFLFIFLSLRHRLIFNIAKYNRQWTETEDKECILILFTYCLDCLWFTYLKYQCRQGSESE